MTQPIADAAVVRSVDTRTLRLRLNEILAAAGLIFSAVVLSTIQFLSHSLPSPDIVHLSGEVVLYAMYVFILIPFVALFVGDRLIAVGDASGRRLRVYRTVLFAATGILTLREVQLYAGPVRSAFDVAGAGQVVPFVLASVGIAYVAWRWHDGFQKLLVHMLPVALVMIVVTFLQMLPPRMPSDGYAAITPEGDGVSSPVFVIVADELAYDALAEGDTIDEELFPNFAALASDSAWLTNATTNYVHTTFIVPGFIEAVRGVDEDYQLRLYGQYAYVESLAWEQCGVEFTCRGAVYESRERTPELLGTLIRRSLFQVTPGAIEGVLAQATGWLQGSLNAPAPNVDRLGMHTMTNAGFDQLIGDVDGESARGTLFFYHALLPHTPFVFNADGSIVTSVGPEDADERYMEQTRYLDSLLGQLIARLKAEGIYDESIVIFTSDHGRREQTIENLEPTFEGAMTVTDGVTQVPLLIHGPNVTPGVYDVDYQHTDFEATLMDVLGQPVPETAGLSVFAESRPDRQKTFFVDQYNELYWSYVYDEEAAAWTLVDFKEEPLFPDGLRVSREGD